MTMIPPGAQAHWNIPAWPRQPHRLPSPRWDPAYDDELASRDAGGPTTMGALAMADPLPLNLAAVARPRPALRSVPYLEEPAERPGPRAVGLVRALLEVMAGGRSPRSLAPAATLEMQPQLGRLARRGRDQQSTWARSLRSLRVTEPAPGVAEVTAVIQQGPRCAALALRMEFRAGQWVLTALEYC
jgi:hypothetical protein